MVNEVRWVGSGKVPSEVLDHDHVKVHNKFSRVHQLVITCYNTSAFVLYKWPFRDDLINKTTFNIRKAEMMKRKRSELPFLMLIQYGSVLKLG